jgi:membrane-bound serine protease (ClpP class)
MNELIAILQNPNVAFLLLVIGGLGLATELIHPNLVTGILGVGALVLAVIGLGSLPVNWPGVILLVAGFALCVAEAQVTSHGILALAGVACVAAGGVLLYRTPAAGAADIHVDPVMVGVTSGLLVVAFLGLSLVAARTRRLPAPVGQLGTAVPAGTPGIVEAPLSPVGSVQLAGETWSARTPDELPLPRGTEVRLVRFEGLTAVVLPVDPADAAASSAARPPATPDPSAAATAVDRS